MAHERGRERRSRALRALDSHVMCQAGGGTCRLVLVSTEPMRSCRALWQPMSSSRGCGPRRCCKLPLHSFRSSPSPAPGRTDQSRHHFNHKKRVRDRPCPRQGTWSQFGARVRALFHSSQLARWPRSGRKHEKYDYCLCQMGAGVKDLIDRENKAECGMSVTQTFRKRKLGV